MKRLSVKRRTKQKDPDLDAESAETLIWTCSACGADNPDSRQTCVSCGGDRAGDSATPKPVEPTVEPIIEPAEEPEPLEAPEPEKTDAEETVVQAVFPRHLFSQALAPREFWLFCWLYYWFYRRFYRLRRRRIPKLCLRRMTRKSVLSLDYQPRTRSKSRLEFQQIPRPDRVLLLRPTFHR